MTELEKLYTAMSRLEIDIRHMKGAIEGTTDTQLRDYLNEIIEGDRYAIVYIAKKLAQEKQNDHRQSHNDTCREIRKR